MKTSQILKTKLRPLTKLMVAKLKECRELENEQKQPCLPKHFGASFPGLYKRKLVGVRNAVVDGKDMVVVYITAEGHAFLDEHQD